MAGDGGDAELGDGGECDAVVGGCDVERGGGADGGAAAPGSVTVGAGPEGEATHGALFDQDRI